MENLYIEHRTIAKGKSISVDVTRHLYARIVSGTVVMLAAEPANIVSALSRQWRQLIRQAHQARASTLRAHRILEITNNITIMERTRFVTDPALVNGPEDILVASANMLGSHPPNCLTLYALCPIDETMLRQITKAMPDHGLVVTYQVEN